MLNKAMTIEQKGFEFFVKTLASYKNLTPTLKLT